MSESLVCITPPAAEPILLDEFKTFLEIPDGDTSRDHKLTSFLLAARIDCERYTRIKLITQAWLLRLDGFPGISVVYDRNGYAQIQLPYPPFQSVDWVKYVDTAGVVQAMPRDASYGTASGQPFYCYQMEPGGGIKPARIMPMWARPYPPSRQVPANTMVQFRCGYGGPLTVATQANSMALTVAGGFKFNPDQAAVMTGDTGAHISIPGADANGGELVTSIASVDINGVATLADQATTAVAGASAWLGQPIPEALRLSIMFHAQFFYEQGAVLDRDTPKVVENLRKSYRNLVS